jgi:hypothetical protein
MNRLEIFVVICLVLWSQQCSLAGQKGARIEQSPEIVPYKDLNSKLPPIQRCRDFQANPENGVLYRGGEGVVPPKVTRGVWVGLTEQGKDAYRNNLFKDPNEVISRISVVIDIEGKPNEPCLAQAAGFDLDQRAAEVAMQYRFKPAQKNGKPTAMRMQIEVRYQTH